MEFNFPVKGGRRWHLSPLMFEAWRTAYRVDVVGELRKAKVWLQANPIRQKTPAGMPRFLVNWLSRAERDRQAVAPLRNRAEHRVPFVAWREECLAWHAGSCPNWVFHQAKMESGVDESGVVNR